jgi:hypothetical protein
VALGDREVIQFGGSLTIECYPVTGGFAPTYITRTSQQCPTAREISSCPSLPLLTLINSNYPLIFLLNSCFRTVDSSTPPWLFDHRRL